MMICPEEYVNNLKNKNIKELEAEIKDLQKEIVYLKAVLEVRLKGEVETRDKILGINSSVLDQTINSSEDLLLFMKREYLKEVIKLYESKGGTYKPTNWEIKDKEFNSNIQHICSFKYDFRGERYCCWNHLYIDVYNGKTIIDAEYFDYEKCDDPDYMGVSRVHVLIGEDAAPVLKSLFKKLKDLHIGEWDNHYEPIDYAVYDGFSWDLKIIFDNETEDFISEGSNCYPFSFEELKNLIKFYATHETNKLNCLEDYPLVYKSA